MTGAHPRRDTDARTSAVLKSQHVTPRAIDPVVAKNASAAGRTKKADGEACAVPAFHGYGSGRRRADRGERQYGATDRDRRERDAAEQGGERGRDSRRDVDARRDVCLQDAVPVAI